MTALTGINEDGFLSAEIGAWITKHRAENKEAFELVAEMSRLGLRIMRASTPRRDSNPHLLAAILYGRCVSHFQGVIVLAERGMISSAKVLVRAMCETTFSLIAGVKDPGFVDVLVKDDRFRQADLIKALLGFPPEDIPISSEELDSLRAQERALRAGAKTDNQRRLRPSEIADKAGLLDFYRLFYVPYSGTVHSAIRDLDGHVRTGADGEIESLKWGPESGGVDDLLDAAIQIFFAASHGILQLFPLPEADRGFETLWATQKARLERKTSEQLRAMRALRANS